MKFRTLFSWIFLLGLSLGACTTHKQNRALDPTNPAESLSRRDLFGNPDFTTVRLSPDGTHVSYLAPFQGVMNLWVAPASDIQKAQVLTQNRERGLRFYKWSYNNVDILYDQDQGGDENWHLHAVDVQTRKSRDLTPYPNTQTHIVRDSAERPNEIVVALNKRDARFHDIYLLNVKTAALKLLEENKGYKEYLVDHDYRVRFAARFEKDGSVNYFEKIDHSENPYREFLRIPSEDSLSTSLFDFDKSGQFLFLRDSRSRNTTALVVLDTKSRRPRLLALDPRADLSDVLLHPRTSRIQAASFEFDKKNWNFFDPSMEEDFKKLSTIDKGQLAVLSRSLDDGHWVVAFHKDTAPTSYYLYKRDTGEARFLFNDRKALAQKNLSSMESQLIPTRDGFHLVSYLSRKSTQAGPLPLVLLVHGGPWSRDSWGLDPYHQLFANRGYAVLSVNFRGSTGFGKKFLNAGNKEWGGRMQDDLVDSVNWAIQQGIADPSRIAIMGGSYGGYATLMGLAQYPDLFACGVDIVGPSNLNTLLASVPLYWESVRQVFVDRVGDPSTSEGREFLESRSPLTFAGQIRKPLLIAQGGNDPRVKKSESEQIVAALRNNSVAVTYLFYPDEGHGFARPENNLSFAAVAENFLAQCLGGKSEDFGNDLKGSSVKALEGVGEISGLKKALRSK